ncbi:MAG: hypothetical protein EPN93_03345 [Spirochaetes bacterium]|nr:MAG: hypothetical protein EPN93_03345 [Spirochaetota bacterium]
MTNTFKTSIAFSCLVLNLYGDRDYREIKEYHDINLYKKYLLKITKSLRYSIESTIHSVDSKHLSDLIELVEHMKTTIGKCKDIHELDQVYLSKITQLCFMIIGDFPKRWKINQVRNAKSIWNLNSHRQLVYIQTAEQKAHSLFSAIQGKYHDRFPSWSDFVLNIYYRECSNNPEILIKWIKKNHPDIYLELF